MSFREELGEKLAEIRERAEQRWATYLAFEVDVRVEDNGELTDTFPYDEPIPTDSVITARHNQYLTLLDDLLARFESFYDLDVRDLRYIARKLGGLELGFDSLGEIGTVHGLLRSSDHRMDDVRQLVVAGEWEGDAPWRGNAAADFYTYFVDPYETASEMQRAYVQEMNLAVGAIHQTIVDTQNDVKAIADACITALQGTSGLQDGAGGDITELFSSVSTIASVVGFTLAPEIFGGISLVSGFSSMFIAARDREAGRKRWTIETPNANTDQTNPEIILQSTWEALTELGGVTMGNDTEIADALGESLRSKEGFGSDVLELPRPRIADEPGAFGESTIPDNPDPDVPVTQHALVVSLAHLHLAGFDALPRAAGLCESAVQQLDGCVLPRWLSSYLPVSAGKFETVRYNLTAVLNRHASALRDTGTNLVHIATTYQLTDELSAERFRQIELNMIPAGYH